MKDVQERSQSMTAYASSHAEPDPETTTRLRERLQASISLRTSKKVRARAWLQGAVIAVVVIGLGLGVAWRMGVLVTGTSTDARGVISTAAQGQDLALDAGRVALGPHTLVRVTESAGATTVLELVDGEVEVRSETPAAITVRAGAYEVTSASRRFAVQRTEGVPLVTVHEGEIRLHGPDLPEAGVVMTAPGG